MKKIKKSLAVVLSLITTIVVLSACTSTEATQKPTEEDPKPTEEVLTTTTEVEPTEEPVVTVEPTTTEATPEPEGDVIIQLWSYNSNMLAVPNDYATLSQFDMGMFICYYDLEEAEETYYSTELFSLSGINEEFRVVECTSGEVYDIDFYISADEYNRPCIWIVNDGNYFYNNNLIPLYYNQTSNCFVAYKIDRETETVKVVEVCFDTALGMLIETTVDDPSVYGL